MTSAEQSRQLIEILEEEMEQPTSPYDVAVRIEALFRDVETDMLRERWDRAVEALGEFAMPGCDLDENILHLIACIQRRYVGCHDCRRPYGDEHGFPDLVVPNDVWARISPTGDEAGLLCPSCIVARCVKLGIECDAEWASGPFVRRI